MLSNIWLFRLQKRQLSKYYSSDRVKLLQATILSNIFLGCAAIVLLFSTGIKIAFPDLMDPVSRNIFLVVDVSLSALCLIAYGFLQTGYFKVGREIFTIAAFVATISSVMLTGGFPNSMVVPCLVILPVVAYLFYGGKVGFALAVTVLAVVLFQWFAVLYLGLTLPDFTSHASSSTNEIIVFAMTFGAIVAMVSIYHSWNQRLQRQLTEERANFVRLAGQDALTGIANSRKFHEELELTGRGASCDVQDFAVVFIDLDDFKSINDNYGHQAGDKVLKAVALRIENCIRDEDLAARIGGDEFAILLRAEFDSLLLDKVKIRLRKIAREPIVVNGVDHKIGMSIGHSKYSKCEDNLARLLKQADQSMYADKSRKDQRKPKVGDYDQHAEISKAEARAA